MDFINHIISVIITVMFSFQTWLYFQLYNSNNMINDHDWENRWKKTSSLMLFVTIFLPKVGMCLSLSLLFVSMVRYFMGNSPPWDGYALAISLSLLYFKLLLLEKIIRNDTVFVKQCQSL